MRHFSVEIDFTQFRKYRCLCNRQVKHIGVEHPLFFPIRNELQFIKARKVISLEFPRFVQLTEVKLSVEIRNELQFVKVRKVISLEFPRFVKLTHCEIELSKYY